MSASSSSSSSSRGERSYGQQTRGRVRESFGIVPKRQRIIPGGGGGGGGRGGGKKGLQVTNPQLFRSSWDIWIKPNLEEKYPTIIPKNFASKTKSGQKAADPYHSRYGPLWTFIPSTTTCLFDIRSGRPLLSTRSMTKIEDYNPYFPPGFSNLSWDKLLFAKCNVQSDDEIASCMVNNNLLVIFDEDFAQTLWRTAAIIPLNTKDIEIFSMDAFKWLKKILASNNSAVTWKLITKDKNGNAIDVRNDTKVKISRFPREPEYSAFVLNDEETAIRNDLGVLSGVPSLATALYVDPEGVYDFSINNFNSSAANIQNIKNVLDSISRHVLDVISPIYDMMHSNNARFNPVYSSSVNDKGNQTGLLCKLSMGSNLDVADLKIFLFLFNHHKDPENTQVVHMFNFRKWIKEVMYRIGNIMTKYPTIWINGRGSLLMTLIAYAVIRGGLEVTFQGTVVSFGGNAMCALQQYRVWNRVCFLHSLNTAALSTKYEAPVINRPLVSDNTQNFIVNAYGVYLREDNQRVCLGHGVDVNTFSGVLGVGNESLQYAAHEASVKYVKKSTGAKLSTEGEWNSRWHSWKSIGRFKIDKSSNDQTIKLKVGLDDWAFDKTVNSENYQYRPSSTKQEEELENLPADNMDWNIDLSTLKFDFDSDRCTEVSIVTQNNDDEHFSLTWHYFVCKMDQVEDFQYYEVFVSDVTVLAGLEYWERTADVVINHERKRVVNSPERRLSCGIRDRFTPPTLPSPSPSPSPSPEVNLVWHTMPDFSTCPAIDPTFSAFWNNSKDSTFSAVILSEVLQRYQLHMAQIKREIDKMVNLGPRNPPDPPSSSSNGSPSNVRRRLFSQTNPNIYSSDDQSNDNGQSAESSQSVYNFTLEDLL